MFRFLKFWKEPVNAISLLPSDKFLVSYPKSGNTWVRFILANIIVQGKVQIDFHSAVKFIPDLEAHPEVIMQMPSPRIIKSHSLYNSQFGKVVYIVRDPRDVYISYYHYLLKKLPTGTTISDFIRKKNIYPSRWNAHVSSWLKKKDILLIKYEDLHLDLVGQVKQIVQFIELPCDDDQLMNAIKHSSFNEMRKIEHERGRPFLNEQERSKSTEFVRAGRTNQWKELLGADDIAYIEAEEGEMMTKLGYI